MRHWLITGANRGIGLETARAALAAGERVTATGRDTEALEAAFSDSPSDRLALLPLDVRDRGSVAAAIARAAAGGIDVVVNNAGYSQMGVFEEVSPEAFEAQYATNVFGTANVLRAVLPVMRSQREGFVVNVASLNGLVALRGSSAYSSSKHAVIGISESLRAEVEPLGIKVTAVCPGAVRTDFLDLGTNSMRWVGESIEDYAELADAVKGRYEAMNGSQPGDPRKVGEAIVELSRRDAPPPLLLLGSAAFDVATEALESRLADFRADEESARAADFEAVSP